MIVLGIDPGLDVGLVKRDGEKLLLHDTLDTRGEPIVMIVEALGGIAEDCAIIAIEDMNPPVPHLGLVRVQDRDATQRLIGALLYVWPDAVMVKPGKHGRGPMLSYPMELRPRSGSGRGSDAKRHLRAAWDIAGAAVTMQKMRAAR